MKCPFHGTVVSSSAYEDYLRLAEVLTLQGLPEDQVHRDQHFVTIIDQCEGSWLYLLRSEKGDQEKINRYGEIIGLIHGLLAFISPTALAVIRQTVKREVEITRLVSLLGRQGLMRGEILFLFAHWTSELFFTRTDIDLKYLAKLLNPSLAARIARRLLGLMPNHTESLELANRISKCLRLNTQVLKILDDFLSADEFMALRKEKLGDGSGVDSPGVSGTRDSARTLSAVTKKRDLSPEMIEALDEISRSWSDWGLTHARLAENKLGKDGIGLQGRTMADLKRRAAAPLLSIPFLAAREVRRAIVKYFQNVA